MVNINVDNLLLGGCTEIVRVLSLIVFKICLFSILPGRSWTSMVYWWIKMH